MDSWRLILPVALPDVCAFELFGFRSFLVFRFAFQAVIGSNFKRTICS